MSDPIETNGRNPFNQGEWIIQQEGVWWTIRKKGRVFKCQTLEDARWLSLLLTLRRDINQEVQQDV